MIKIKQINQEYVKPVNFQDEVLDSRPIKGSNLFSEIYANIFVIAKKKSGKTTVLYKTVKECTTQDTTVLVFCSTLDKDKSHKAIKQYCEVKNIPYVGYTSMKDDEHNIDILDVLIKDLQAKAKQQQEEEEESEEEEPVKKDKLVLFESSDEEDYIPKKRKNKFRSPEYLIILDDLSNELKSKVLTKLCKMNRHFKFKIIISTQYVHDVLPETIKQQDYILIFKGQPEAKLRKIHTDADLSIDFDVFDLIYKNATKERFNFLYIDVRNETFRRNFTHKYDLSKELIE